MAVLGNVTQLLVLGKIILSNSVQDDLTEDLFLRYQITAPASRSKMHRYDVENVAIRPIKTNRVLTLHPGRGTTKNLKRT